MSIGYACLNIGTPNTNIPQRHATQRDPGEADGGDRAQSCRAGADDRLQPQERHQTVPNQLGSDPVRLEPGERAPLVGHPRRSLPAHRREDPEEQHAGVVPSGPIHRPEFARRKCRGARYPRSRVPRQNAGVSGVSTISTKIVLHVGGIYGDKKEALERFELNFRRLPEAVRNRLIIENDDRLYNIEEVLELAHRLQIPAASTTTCTMPSTQRHQGGTDPYWIAEVKKTWKAADGNQKIHYSQQAPGKRPARPHRYD